MSEVREQASHGWVVPLVATIGILCFGTIGYMAYKEQLIDENATLLGHEGARFKAKAGVFSISELMKIQEYLKAVKKNKDWEAVNTQKLNAAMSEEDKKKGYSAGSGESPEYREYMKLNGKQIGMLIAKISSN